jgi:hypothetical protein
VAACALLAGCSTTTQLERRTIYVQSEPAGAQLTRTSSDGRVWALGPTPQAVTLDLHTETAHCPSALAWAWPAASLLIGVAGVVTLGSLSTTIEDTSASTPLGVVLLAAGALGLGTGVAAAIACTDRDGTTEVVAGHDGLSAHLPGYRPAAVPVGVGTTAVDVPLRRVPRAHALVLPVRYEGTPPGLSDADVQAQVLDHLGLLAATDEEQRALGDCAEDDCVQRGLATVGVVAAVRVARVGERCAVQLSVRGAAGRDVLRSALSRCTPEALREALDVALGPR